MNRLPRRTAPVRSPLRGRSATVSPRGQTRHPHLMPVVRRRPPASRKISWQVAPKLLRKDGRPYSMNKAEVPPTNQTKVQPKRSKRIDQPQKWLLLIALLVVLLAGIITFVSR
ncbi:MAG: hypothetical protein ACFBSF_06575 [Leptolyngbyaceae cyanobacterium]